MILPALVNLISIYFTETQTHSKTDIPMHFPTKQIVHLVRIIITREKHPNVHVNGPGLISDPLIHNVL